MLLTDEQRKSGEGQGLPFSGHDLTVDPHRTASKPAAMDDDGFEQIPAHLLAEGQGGPSASTGGASTSASASGPIACPHCTYENAPGATDCDVCGLPLRG